jgi:hypothetical protein
MKLFSYILSCSLHCWYVERLLIFFKLLLYPTTWLKLFMMSWSFLVEFPRSCNYKIMLFANRYTFIFSSYLIYLTKNSRAMLNKSGKSRHPCLIPDLKGNGFSFSLFSMIRSRDTTPGHIKECKSGCNRDTCTLMFITALFTIPKLWKQLSYPTTDKWIKKMWYLYLSSIYLSIYLYLFIQWSFIQQKGVMKPCVLKVNGWNWMTSC